MSRLTPHQTDVLNFILREVISQRPPPTVQEIATHFGISWGRAEYTRDVLERKNVIQIYQKPAPAIPPAAAIGRFTIVNDVAGRAVGAFQPLPALYRS